MSKQKPPFPVRIPDEWEAEIESARNRLGLSKHGWILKALRRVLDGEKRKTGEVPSDLKPGGMGQPPSKQTLARETVRPILKQKDKK